MSQDTYKMPTQDELNSLLRQADQLRAETAQAIFAAVGRAIASAVSTTYSALVRIAEGILEGHRAQLMYQELSRLSDRELAAIGLSRGDIAAVAAGTHLRQAHDLRAEVPAEAATPATVTPLKPTAAPVAPQVREAA